MRLGDLCARMRSKNAGPYWVTVDIFFRDRASFDTAIAAPALGRDAVAARLGVAAAAMKRFELPDLLVVKYSYPRDEPQGGRVERDMHGGQLYARLLDLDLDRSADDWRTGGSQPVPGTGSSAVLPPA